MAARRVYTDADRAAVKNALDVNEGNIKRTARDTGIPVMTVKGWVRKWEKGGLPAEVSSALPAIREEFVGNATRLRDKMLVRLEEKVDDDMVNSKDLLIGVGVLTDKVRLVEGKSTSRTEHEGAVGSLPVDQVRELFAGFARGIVEAAVQRDAAISSATGEETIDAEWSEQANPALTP